MKQQQETDERRILTFLFLFLWRRVTHNEFVLHHGSSGSIKREGEKQVEKEERKKENKINIQYASFVIRHPHESSIPFFRSRHVSALFLLVVFAYRHSPPSYSTRISEN